jgi:hypothetical protein
MNRLVVGTIAAVFPFTASFAAGLNVNLHNVAAAKVASLPALPATAARGNALAGLSKLPASPVSLPGIPELPIGLPSPPPTGAPNGWLQYDVHVWPQQFGGYLFAVGGFVRDGLKFQIVPMLESDISCDANPDCGGTNHVAQQGFDLFGGIAQIIIGGIVIPRPLPKMPPPIEAILGGGGGPA